MSRKRLISFDNETKISNNFTFEEDTSGKGEHSFVLSREQDVTEILKENRDLYNDSDKRDPYGHWNKVASIPMVLYYDLKEKGILDDPKALKKWLNDPDNKAFRTREGTV